MDLARNLIVVVGLPHERWSEAVILTGQPPKTSTGKIQKNVVRSEHARHYEEG